MSIVAMAGRGRRRAAPARAVAPDPGTVRNRAITDTAAITVSGEAPAGPTLVFNSQWATATGTTENAISDGGAWDGVVFGPGDNSGPETLASLSLTEPSELSTIDNAFVNRADGPDWSDACAAEYIAGNPSNGQTRYFRMYYAMLIPDAVGTATQGNVEHGSESAETGGGDGWNFPMRLPRADGTWWPAYRDINTAQRFVADGLSLAKETFYRIEWALTYGATTYTVQVRIYDESGVLVADESDFYQRNPSLDTEILLGDVTFAYTAAEHSRIRIGNNGPTTNYPGVGGVGTPPANNDGMHAVTGYAYATADWCGRYIDGNG